MRRASLIAIVVACLLAGCALTPAVIDDRLFFGRSIPGGGEVTEAQWNAFLAEVVTPRFPDGFTVWRGSGQWKGDDGAVVSEASCVLEILHPSDPAIDAKVEAIARAYRERFNQEAVMRVRQSADQSFSRR